MIKGILFDKDGTLIEFERTWHSIMTLFFTKLRNQDIVSESDIEKIKKVSGYTETGFVKESKIQYLPTSQIIDLWIKSLAIEEEEIREKLEEQLEEQFIEASIDDTIEISLLPHTRQVLDYLSKKYHLGIVTADLEKSMVHSLNKSRLTEFFQYLGFDDGIIKGKPSPMMAFDFCELTGIKPSELLVVGDSVSDYQFAINSKAFFAGISNNYGALTSLHNENNLSFPLVNDLQQLVEVLNL